MTGLNHTGATPELIDHCLKGSSKACHSLYSMYAKGMFNICLRILNNYHEAEDVLQEAFVKAFKNLKNYDKDRPFGVWLKRIVVNTALTALRKRGELVFSEDLTNEADSTASYDDVEWQVEKVRRGMSLLPEGYRVVMSLYLFEGYDHQEIGEILRISPETSKSQYSRGKKKLISIMNGHLETEIKRSSHE